MRTKLSRSVAAAILLSALSLGLFTQCKGNAGGKASKIAFDSIVVEKKIPLLQVNDTTLPFADVHVSYTYPVKFKDSQSLARLQQIMQGTFFGDSEIDTLAAQDAVDQHLENYTARYQSLSNHFYEDKARIEGKMPSWYWYYMNRSNKILYQGSSLLSYAVEYSDYEGGAHGSYRITYTNVDLNELVTLSEEDLFVPGYFAPLTEKIVAQLMVQYEAPVADSLLMKGFFTIEDIVPNNNFWLDEENIHYSFNQYEIAPYAMGVIDVSVPYTDLEDILLPEGPISRFFQK